MKFRTEIKTRFVDVTIGDKTQKIEEKYEERIPVVPRDWDEISTKAGFALVGVLTLIAIVWSTISIGALLGGGVGFAAAALFDISWAVCLILEWKSRFDPGKRKFPRNLGWALLAVTMFFIGWHGIELDSVPLAVIGACVSLFAKVLWLGVMKHVDKELTPEHAAWVQKTISEANAKMAVAAVLRQVARMEDDAVAQHLAIEMSRHGVVGVEQLLSGQPELAATPPHTVATPPRHGLYTREVPESQYEPGTVEYDHDKFSSADKIHEPVVYFVRNGDRIKIGYSTCLGKRVQGLTLRMSDVVRVEYGDREYERTLHEQFEEYRIGNTAWFILEGELAEYVGAEYDDSTGEYGHTVSPNTGEYEPTVRANTDRTTLGYDRSTAVAEMVKMIKSGNGPSYNEAERMFGRPKSTVVGWVKAARKEAEEQ